MPVVATEGRTEVLGDLVLVCTGLTNAVSADVTLALNTNVTNRIISWAATDAVLRVNEGYPQHGVVAGYNVLRWEGVTLAPSSGGRATLRISDVRADVSLLGFPSVTQPKEVTGMVEISSLAPVPISNAGQTMAHSAPALVFMTPASPPAGGVLTTVPLEYTETALDSFRTAEGSTPTRLRMWLTGVPSTVQVYAPVYPSDGTMRAQLYSAESNGMGGAPVPGSYIYGGLYQQLSPSGGMTTATWVVQAAGAARLESFPFGLLLVNASSTDLINISATGSLAPVSYVAVASATAPVPRYRDFSVAVKLVNLRLTSVRETALPPSVGVKAGAEAQASGRLAASSSVTFTHRLVNDTSDPTQVATNLVIEDNLPPGLSLVSCTASGGVSCGGVGRQVQVNYGILGAGQSQTMTVVAQVDPSLAEGTVVSNQVSVRSDQVDAELAATTASSSFVIDRTPPVISGMPATGCTLWPPNHSMVQVATVTAADALSGLSPGSFEVTGSSNQPSDPKDPDIVITPNGSGGFVIQLRAERLGNAVDRIYTLSATASDLAGNTATITSTCTVPDDQGR